MQRTKRVAAIAAGAGTLAAGIGGNVVVLSPAAHAAAAPGQDVNNDWGQTAAEVDAEIAAAVDADPRVVAARTRYLRALANYGNVKQAEKDALAAYRKARKTPSLADDRATLRRLKTIQAQVYPRACEVVASQLAMVKTVDAVTAAVRSHHYIKAPYVALPAQPVGLVAEGRSGQVLLTWTAVSGASQYRVYRDGTQVGSSLVPTFIDTGLTDGTAYGYRVMAVNVAGWSPLSGEVIGLPTAAAPDAPTGLTALAGDAQVSLTWLPSATATHYDVFRNGILVGSPTTTSFTDTGLVDGTTYSYTVTAVNDTVSSVASAAVQAVPIAVAPGAPTGLVAAPGDGQITLTWSPVSGATSYRVFRDGQSIGTNTTPSFIDTGLTNGVTHTYYVVAYRLNSPASGPSSSVTSSAVATPLSTPTGLSAAPGDGQISLSWNAVPGATSYRVYRGATLAGSPAGTSFTDTGLSNGTSYSYTVVAVSAVATSAASAAVTATPASAAPGAPTGLSGQAGDTTATLSWTAVAGATSYKIYRGGVLRTTVTTTGFTDTGLTNGTGYQYYVTAVKSGVESAASSTVTVTPVAIVPGTPTGLVAAAGDAQVTLNWTPSANATSYRVYRGATLVGSPASATYTDTGLTNGTGYSYTVVAVNGTAASAASAAATATPMAPAPAAPTGLSATAGNAQVVLTWTASATATSYRVYRNAALVASPTTTTYTDTGLTNGTTYSYYVVAVTATTPSTASTTVTATPVKPPVNGTFTGATTAISSGHGTIRVVIVVSNSKITSATGTLVTNDGQQETISINNTSIPQYNTKAVTANSASITKVSGATLTWAAYKTSLQSALTQAGM